MNIGSVGSGWAYGKPGNQPWTLSSSLTIENMPSGERSWIMSKLSLRISISRLSIGMLLRYITYCGTGSPKSATEVRSQSSRFSQMYQVPFWS